MSASRENDMNAGRGQSKSRLEDKNGQHPFKLFVSPWKKNLLPPESWYTNHEKKRPVIKTLIWAPTLSIIPGMIPFSLYKTQAIQNLMTSLANHNLSKYDVQTSINNDANMLTRQSALKYLGEIGLQAGDNLVLFYFGFGITHAGTDGIVEPMFVDDMDRDLKEFTLWNALSSLAAKQSIHIAVIMDLMVTHMTPHPISIDAAGDLENVIFLRGPAPSFLPNVQISEDKFFFTQLTDIISGSGGKLRYDNLFSTLRIRYTQQGQLGFPMMFGFPDSTTSRYIFSGIAAGKSGYLVQHDTTLGWILNGGSANGLNPSNIFMDTLIELENGKHVIVDKVELSHSTLRSFEEIDTGNVFAVRLVQNAFPKIRFTFHPDITEDLQLRLKDTLSQFELCFAEWVEKTNAANYLITDLNGGFSLARNTPTTLQYPDPIFSPEDDMEQLFRKIESIGKWEAVLEMQNVGSSFPVQDLDVIIEPIEGIEWELEELEEVHGPILVNSDNVRVQVRNAINPSIKCYLPDSGKLNGYHAQFLYLDNGYAISTLPTDDGTTSDESARSFAKVKLHVDEFNLQRKKVEVADYLLLFISENEMNLSPLTQYTLGHVSTAEQNEISKITSDVFTLPEGDWTVRKIPIYLKHDNRTFEETVRETIKSRPITVPNDLHKNRWGGRAKRNGFTLSASVEKSFLPLMYNVILTVLHDTMEPDGGEVAFLLHDSFSPATRFIRFFGEAASIEIKAYEDFTAAAILYDGTELELDLSEISGLPEEFYAVYVPNDFKLKVDLFLAERPIMVSDDLHKKRWGGKMNANGYSLSANVQPDGDRFLVTLNVALTNTSENTNNVAFLLHNSFHDPIRYKRIVNGKAVCSVRSYEAFTAAVILSDGTTLELDLNDRTLGFPDDFFYETIHVQS